MVHQAASPGGAYALEFEAARPAITRWAQERFERLREQGGTVGRPRQIMEQILDTPTVNLVTSPRREPRARDADQRRPAGDASSSTRTGCSDILGLDFPPPFVASAARSTRSALEKFDVRLEDGQGFVQKGDTHFCFLVPERAFEDQVVLREAIEIGLVSKRLAACLLMVDPWNPVFSERRRALLRHVPATARDRERQEQLLGRAWRTRSSPPPSRRRPARRRREFAERWAVGRRVPARRSTGSSRATTTPSTTQLKTQAGFDAYFQLAEERRQRFKARCRSREFPLLLPQHEHHRARAQDARDGTVGTG